MNRQQYFIYIKDKDGNRTGTTIAVVLKPEGIWHGQSDCAVEDQFEYKKGRELALERAEEAYQRYLDRKEASN